MRHFGQAHPTLIAICTRDRDESLKILIDQLASQIIEERESIKVAVIQNGDGTVLQDWLTQYATKRSIDIIFEIERNSGVVHARNRALEIARRGFQRLIFLDDDEQILDGWLSSILSVARKYPNAMVVGPVKAVVENSEWPIWAKGDRPWSRAEHADGTKILTPVGNGNLLLPSIFLAGDWAYNPALNLTGGEDTFLTLQWLHFGGEIRYARNAVATELVVPNRLEYDFCRNLTTRQATTWARIAMTLGMNRLSLGAHVLVDAARLVQTSMGLWNRHWVCSSYSHEVGLRVASLKGKFNGFRLGPLPVPS